MIEFVKGYIPVYRIKDIVNPPYPIYYIVSADFNDTNEKGYWAMYIVEASKKSWANKKDWVKVFQDDMCYEKEALELIGKLRSPVEST